MSLSVVENHITLHLYMLPNPFKKGFNCICQTLASKRKVQLQSDHDSCICLEFQVPTTNNSLKYALTGSLIDGHLT